MKKYFLTLSLVLSFFLLSSTRSYAADFQVTNITDPSCSATSYDGPAHTITCAEISFLGPSITRWMFNFDTLTYSQFQTLIGGPNLMVDLFRASDNHNLTSVNAPWGGNCQGPVQDWCMAINYDGGVDGHFLIYGPSTYGNNPVFSNIPDGEYYLGVWNRDYPVFLYKSNVFTLPVTQSDTTAPTITIQSPSGTVSSQTVAVNVSVTDQSGVASTTYTVDGNTIANTATSLDLTYYQPGVHTFTVTATDTNANTGSQSSTFTYSPTTASLTGELNTMYANGDITGLGNSLYNQLNLAQRFINNERYLLARLTLDTLLLEIRTQRGNHITPAAADVLIAQIRYLKNSLLQ